MTDNSNLVAGMTGGNHISGAPLTTDLTAQVSPELLRNAIDKAVVKIRPMATPLDQISRLGHVRDVDSMEVDYYSVDCRKSEAKVSKVDVEADEENYSDNCRGFKVQLDETGVFEASEGFAFTRSDGSLGTGYVVEKLDGGSTVRVRIPTSEGAVSAGMTLVRLGRAATQLDVQSPQFSVVPKKQTNYCQIFKMQIEQSVVMKLSHKEIGWDFTDQQEAAVYDMRLGMEKQFL